MMLVTKALAAKLPDLYANEGKDPADVPVIFKLFNPGGAGTWYITEGNLNHMAAGTLFGLCVIQEPELGYVDLGELSKFRGRFGLKIERDLHWRGTLADAMKAEGYSYDSYKSA